MQNTQKKATKQASAKQAQNKKNIITKQLKNNTYVKYYSVNNKANNFNVVNSKASNKTHLQKLNTTQAANYNVMFNAIIKATNLQLNNTVKSYVAIKVTCKTIASINVQFYCNANVYFIYMETAQQHTKKLLQFVQNLKLFNTSVNNVYILATQQSAVYVNKLSAVNNSNTQQVISLLNALQKF